MRILTQAETTSILGRELTELVDRIAAGSILRSFAIPPDAGKRTVMARSLSMLLLEVGPVFIHVTGWGVWPSSENWDLVNMYRLAHGENRPMSDAPVHMFQEGEDQLALFSILTLVLFNLWDAEVVSSKGDFLLSISHDEWIDVRAANADLGSAIIAELAMLEPQATN